MLLVPVRGPRLERSTRLNPLKCERFQFFHPLLVSLNEPLQIGFDA